jgi:hypothetical protein
LINDLTGLLFLRGPRFTFTFMEFFLVDGSLDQAR